MSTDLAATAPHRFNPDHLAHLDNPLRRLLNPASRTLERLGIASEDVVVDVGAGSGYFSAAASRIVGPRGRVIAVDVAPAAIALLERKRVEERLENLETFLASGADLGVADGEATVVFFHTVLHEVEDKPRLLDACYRALAPGGRILIVEFRARSPFGPPRSERISEETMRSLLEAAGFSRIAIIPSGWWSYCAAASKESH